MADTQSASEDITSNAYLRSLLLKNIKQTSFKHDARALKEEKLMRTSTALNVEEIIAIDSNLETSLFPQDEYDLFDSFTSKDPRVQFGVSIIPNNMFFWKREEIEFRALSIQYFLYNNGKDERDVQSFPMQKLFIDTEYGSNKKFTQHMLNGRIKHSRLLLQNVKQNIKEVTNTGKPVLVMCDLNIYKHKDIPYTFIAKRYNENKLRILNPDNTVNEISIQLMRYLNYKNVSIYTYIEAQKKNAMQKEVLYIPKPILHPIVDWYEMKVYSILQDFSFVPSFMLLLLKDEDCETVIENNEERKWLEKYPSNPDELLDSGIEKGITVLEVSKESKKIIYWCVAENKSLYTKNIKYYTQEYITEMIGETLNQIYNPPKVVETEQLRNMLKSSRIETYVEIRRFLYSKLMYVMQQHIALKAVPTAKNILRMKEVENVFRAYENFSAMNINVILMVLINKQLYVHNFRNPEVFIKELLFVPNFKVKKYTRGDLDLENTGFVVKVKKEVEKKLFSSYSNETQQSISTESVAIISRNDTGWDYYYFNSSTNSFIKNEQIDVASMTKFASDATLYTWIITNY